MLEQSNFTDINKWTVLFVRTAPIGATYVASQDYYPLGLAALGAKIIFFSPAPSTSSVLQKTIEPSDNVQIIEAQQDKWYPLLRNAIQTYAPDIVHVYNNTSKLQFLYRLSLKIRSRFVIDFRSPILSKGLRGSLIQSKTTLDAFSFTSVASHSIGAARTFIGNSRSQIEWLPPGIEIDKFIFKPNVSQMDSPAKVIYIGSLNQRRQLENMIHAIALAKPQAKFTVDIYGSGDGSDKLQQLVQQNDLDDIVHFKGMVEPETIQNILHKYDIGLCYTHRSLYETAPPLKAVEYLACGVPVIATNTQGNATFIQDSVNGLLVDEAPEIFGEGIVRLIQNPQLHYKMVENSRNSIEDFSWTKLVHNRLVPYYLSLLNPQ